jgi:23S rRNA (guanine2445-N2)-methyltransferase / 23S rRNA (guanine2069-N7)-methyltransferase
MGVFHKLIITCPLYCEDLIEGELAQWGVTDTTIHHGAVAARGDLEGAYRICIRSRVANRVLWPLLEFDAADKSELMERITAFPFDEHFSTNDSFAIDSQISHSFLPNPNIANLVVKDAVADSFRRRTGQRPGVDVKDPSVRLHLFLEGRRGTVSVVLSPAHLFRRSLRKRSGDAPLKENVAAVVLLRAGWPALAAAGGAFVDLMCGSGTFLYEALLMAGGIAPGALRGDAGPGAWQGHDHGLWKRLVTQAAEERRAGLARRLPLVIGYDIDEAAVKNTMENLREADLLRHIHVTQSDFRLVKAPGGGVTSGLVAANPPYGRRLGSGENITRLYKDLGRVLSTEFNGFRAVVLAGDRELSRAVGLRAEKLHTVYNGPIRCTLAHFSLNEGNIYRPPV